MDVTALGILISQKKSGIFIIMRNTWNSIKGWVIETFCKAH